MSLSIFVDYLNEGGGKRCRDGMWSGGVCTGRRSQTNTYAPRPC